MCSFIELKHRIRVNCSKEISVPNTEQLMKLKEYGFKIVYQKEQYIVLQKPKHKEILVWNTFQPWKTSTHKYHAHLECVSMAKILVDSIASNKKLRTKDSWVLTAYNRVCFGLCSQQIQKVRSELGAKAI